MHFIIMKSSARMRLCFIKSTDCSSASNATIIQFVITQFITINECTLLLPKYDNKKLSTVLLLLSLINCINILNLHLVRKLSMFLLFLTAGKLQSSTKACMLSCTSNSKLFNKAFLHNHTINFNSLNWHSKSVLKFILTPIRMSSTLHIVS